MNVLPHERDAWDRVVRAQLISRARRAFESRVNILTVLVAFWLALGAANAHAAGGTPQDLDAIRAFVRQFVAKNIQTKATKLETEIGTIDPRLHLPACASIEGFFAPGAPRIGNTTVGARCRKGASWTLYVPVRVRVWRPVLVAARAVPRGALLAATDLRIEPREITAAGKDFLEKPAEAQGKRAKRGLAPGTVITANVLAPPHLVRRGDRVTLIVENSSLTVRATGEALTDGQEGDRVRVRNALTKKVVQGTVVGPGTVEVPL